MKISIKNVLLALCFTFGISMYGQIDFKQIIPTNPNVASLFKSVVTPVNEYNGLPNIAIPLYTVQEGGITVPISLNYTMGGIQVGEESGSVGLGWNLMAGGAITRSINGFDDFLPTYGYLEHTVPRPDMSLYNPGVPLFTSADSNCEFPLNGVATDYGPIQGALVDTDFMPDMFYYNFNGYSGSFVADKYQYGKVVLLEKEGIKIEFSGTGNGQYSNVVFYATTADGTIYQFSQRADTFLPNGPTPSVNRNTTTWHLTKITDVAGNFVQFVYLDKGWMEPLESFTQSWEIPTDLRDDQNPSKVYRYYTGPKTQIQNFYINEIRFGKKSIADNYDKIVFNYSMDGVRQDVKTNYLESINVIDRNNQNVKNIALTYSYFGQDYASPFFINSYSIANGDYAEHISAFSNQAVKPHVNLRLRLDKVVEDGISEHSFEYYGSGKPVPNKTSFSPDYWGFFNNQSNFGTFIPELRDEYGAPLNFPQFNKAKRFPDEEYANYFSLKKVTYPAKGSTEFEYELNTYTSTQFQNVVPPATVQKDTIALANENKSDHGIVITPNQNANLYLEYSVVIRGWNTGPDYNNPLPKPSIDTNKFQNNFYVTLEDINGNIITKKHVPSSIGFDLWNSYDPYTYCDPTNNQNPNCTRTIECNSTGVTYCGYNDCTNSGQPAIIFTCSEEWLYGNPIPGFNLTDNQYVIKAHFDDMGGQIYGQASIRATWSDVAVSEVKDYSVGGGLRIKSITDRDIDGSIETKRNFNYHYKELVEGEMVEKSYGRIKTLPNFYSDHRTLFYLKLFSVGFSNYYGEVGLPKIVGKATSQNNFSKDQGSYVGYDQIEISSESPNGDNGKVIKKYLNVEDRYLAANPPEYIDDYYKYPPVRLPINGLLSKTESYKRTNNDLQNPTYALVSETEQKYKINEAYDADTFDFYDLWTNTDVVISGVKERPVSVPFNQWVSGPDCTTYKFQFYPYFSNLVQPTEVVQRSFDSSGNNPVEITETYAYENSIHLQRTKTTTSNSDGSIQELQIFYPDDIANASGLPEGGALTTAEYNAIAKMKKSGQHHIGVPIQTVTKKNGNILSIQRTIYNQYGQYVDPVDTNQNLDVLLPNLVKTAKGNTSLEDRFVYDDYIFGNPKEVKKEDGMTTSFIWGYQNAYPIAKIENASYADIAQALGITTNQLEEFDEGDLSTIEGLRNTHPQFMISTYTFLPLIGVGTMTDSRGATTHYEYDVANRLKWIKDLDQNLLTDYRYHYNGQGN